MIGIAALAVCACARAEAPVEVSVTLDPPVVPFHKQTRFTIAVEGPDGVQVEFAEMAGKFGGLDVHAAPTTRLEHLRGGRVRLSKTYVLDPIFIGNYVVAPVEVTVQRETGPETITIPSPTVRVRDLTPEEREAAEQFAPNAGLVNPYPGLARDWRVWAALGVAAVIAVALVVYLVRRRRVAEEAAPPAPPWEVAYARLRALDAKHWPEAGEVEAFYVELSDIVRHYIEDQFALHAPEQTTPEFLNEAARSGVFTESQQTLLAVFLRHCDRVKFAKYEPGLDEMERSFASVLRFIDETVPAQPQPEEDAA
jgi:hypothetical protein